MPARFRRQLGLLALIMWAGTPVAPAWGVEEIVRIQIQVVDCQDMLEGSRGCLRAAHQFVTTNPNETRASQTFFVYTKAEIDERLKKVKASVDPALEALAAEVAQLKRSLAEVNAGCAATPRAARD
jgi:hypothetical protein